MNLNQQIEQFHDVDERFNQVSSNYEIHNARIHAMINYFENVRSIFSKVVSKKDKYQITKSKFGRQISNDLNFCITPGNPGFQLKYVDTLIHFTSYIISEFDFINKHIKENTIKQLTNLVNSREKKFKEISSKYNDAADAYQKAQNNYKTCHQNLTSSLSKLEQTQQNWEAQQNQINTPQKGGFSLFHKLKPSKSKTDINGAIQNYRKCIRSTEYSIYALNSAYSNFLRIANECILSLESDIPSRKIQMRGTLHKLSLIYINAANFYSSIPEYKNKMFQNEDSYYLQVWESDFIQFIQKAQISRLPLNTIVFNPSEFSNAEPSPMKPVQPIKYFDYPLGFATVTQDFPFIRGKYLTSPNLDKENEGSSKFDLNQADQEPRRQSFQGSSNPQAENVPTNFSYADPDSKNNKHYLSVKEGQRVYYYNSLHDEWTLASLSINGPRKYILSSCLAPYEISKCGMAIVKHIKFEESNDYLTVTPGELLTVAKRDVEPGVELCTNIKGETGLIKKDCIIMLNE